MRRVPVIDLRDFSNPLRRIHFIHTLGDAFRELGFVRLKGHNVDSTITDPAYKSIREFFALSKEVKQQYMIVGGAGQRGYTPYLAESAKGSDLPDLKEFWHVGRELSEEDDLHDLYAPNVWPKEVIDFKKNSIFFPQIYELQYLKFCFFMITKKYHFKNNFLSQIHLNINL